MGGGLWPELNGLHLDSRIVPSAIIWFTRVKARWKRLFMSHMLLHATWTMNRLLNVQFLNPNSYRKGGLFLIRYSNVIYDDMERYKVNAVMILALWFIKRENFIISGLHLNFSSKLNRWWVDCERTTDYRSRISCLNLTSLFALFVFLLCRVERQLWGYIWYRTFKWNPGLGRRYKPSIVVLF
jgi:hypothetical protein